MYVKPASDNPRIRAGEGKPRRRQAGGLAEQGPWRVEGSSPQGWAGRERSSAEANAHFIAREAERLAEGIPVSF